MGIIKKLLLIILLLMPASSRATTYYISTTGNDSTGDGSLGNPWGTPYKINSLSSLNPGDQIQFRGGTYYINPLGQTINGASSTCASVRARSSGSLGNPIIITHYPGESVTFDGQTPIVNSVNGSGAMMGTCDAYTINYVTWDGFTFINFGYKGMLLQFGTGLTIQNMNISGARIPNTDCHPGDNIEGIALVTSYATIKNNYIHNIHNYGWTVNNTPPSLPLPNPSPGCASNTAWNEEDNASGIKMYLNDHLNIQNNEIYDAGSCIYDKDRGVLNTVILNYCHNLDSIGIKIGSSSPLTPAQTGYSYTTASGTDTYTATLSPAPASYVNGAQYNITFTNGNASTTPTLNLNGLGPKTIVGHGPVALVASSNAACTSSPQTAYCIPAGQSMTLFYDGTNIEILGTPGTTNFLSGVGVTNETVSQNVITNIPVGLLIEEVNNYAINNLSFYSNTIAAYGAYFNNSGSGFCWGSTFFGIGSNYYDNICYTTVSLTRFDQANYFTSGVDTNPPPNISIADYNDFYNAVKIVGNLNGSHNVYTTLTGAGSWNADSGLDGHSIATDPKFINSASDWHLGVGSPAINAGKSGGTSGGTTQNIGAYITGSETIGCTLSVCTVIGGGPTTTTTTTTTIPGTTTTTTTISTTTTTGTPRSKATRGKTSRIFTPRVKIPSSGRTP